MQSVEPRVKNSIVSEESVAAASQRLSDIGTNNHQFYKRLVTSIADCLESTTL